MFNPERVGGLGRLLELSGRLSDVDGDANYLIVVVLLFEQRYADGRVEPARKGKRDAVVCHVACRLWCRV